MSDVKILNPQQVEAIEYGVGPLLIIAGAGSGKTTVITERIKHLILKKNVPPDQILALTFTEKASKEMEERVDVAMPYGVTQMWISTFHSFCDRILRNEAIHIGLDPSYTLNSQAQSILFLKKRIFELKLHYFRPLGNPNKFLEGMLQHFSRLKDEDINPEQYLKYVQGISNSKFLISNKKTNNESRITNNLLEPEDIEKNLELANAYKTYENLKAKEGVMDFSDLISNTLKLFRKRPNILKIYQDQFAYILVDEFQDTNFSQNELAVLLSGDRKNITVVGDDDQAIYRWRGAAISNIIQFRQHFPHAKIVTLTKNYRSTKEILDKSYVLIQNNNPDRLEVKEKVNKKLTTERKIKGQPIEFIFTERVEDEADQVAKKIQTLTNNQSQITNHYAFKDFAILVRANDHALPFTKALQRHNIPYQFLGPGQLFHQDEIKDLISFLKVLYNFEDSVSLYRLLTIPIFSLKSEQIAALLNLARKKNITLFEALTQTAHAPQQEFDIEVDTTQKETLKKIYNLIKKYLDRVAKDTAGQILYNFVQDTGILQELVQAKTEKEVRVAQNTAKFFDKLKTYETEHEQASVFDIVDWIDLSMQLGESPLATDIDWSENNAVNILTIHSSKGLEFPVVFLPCLVNQRFPTRQRREQIPIPQELIKEILPTGDAHMEEERRLFYVGMTRARDRLFFSAAKFYGEGKMERKVSPFVYEALGEEKVSLVLNKQKEQRNVIQPTLFEWIPKNSEQKSVNGEQRITNNQSRITYLSYSQLQTFAICPLHYKLKYLLKVPSATSSAQNFGTSVHAVLRDFYTLAKSEKVNSKTLEKLLEKNWIDEGYGSKAHEKKAYQRAKEIVSLYIEKNFTPSKLPLALELPFQFWMNKVRIGGRIDRIDSISDATIEILDYKTGNNVPSEKDLAKDLQLTFYALAATEVKDKILGKKPEEVLLSLYYLEENKKLTTTRTRQQLENAKTEILEKIAVIEQSDFKCSGNMLCQTCEYKMLCSTS